MLYLTNEELATKDFPQEPFLVSPTIPMGGILLVYGKRNIGKTQLCLTLAHNVAMGEKFLGIYPVAQGPVVYIQLDTPPMIQQNRVNMIRDEWGAGYDHDNLHWVISDSPIDIVDIARQSVTPEWSKRIQALQPHLVVVDTMRKCHRMDENNSETPLYIYSAWRYLLGSTPTIAFIHHDKKTSEFKGMREEEFRGSGAFLDDADTGIHMRSRKGSLVVDWTKVRTCRKEDLPASSVAMNPTTLLIEPESPAEAFIVDAKARGVSRKEIIAEAKKLGMAQATVYRRLQGYSEG